MVIKKTASLFAIRACVGSQLVLTQLVYTIITREEKEKTVPRLEPGVELDLNLMYFFIMSPLATKPTCIIFV